MLFLQGVAYIHPNKELLFEDLCFTVNRRDKIALVGNNGVGKSTLLRLMAGDVAPSRGQIKREVQPYYVPQLLGQLNEASVAQALRIDDKLNALNGILAGEVTNANLELLDDDWEIEKRAGDALLSWGLEGLALDQKMGSLSGGEKTKVLLAGISIHRPAVLLLDEPSNHLDGDARAVLYEYIRSTGDTLVVVSHDRNLLRLTGMVAELSKKGLKSYGGNYDLYAEQKQVEGQALEQGISDKEKELRKAKVSARESLERQQRSDARGRNKQEKAGLPTILLKTFQNKAEKTGARLKGIHAEKVDAASRELDQLRNELADPSQMRLDLDSSSLHKGKILVMAKDLDHSYDPVRFGEGERLLWKEPLSFELRSGERVALKGPNGAGKTSLIRIVLGELEPRYGVIERAAAKAIYIDQDYSLIDGTLSVFEQAQQYNSGELQEHEIKIRLSRFLFSKEDWDKPCRALSGGEKMRLLLCALTIGEQAPDLIVLDEPTNNLDIQNLEILVAGINGYEGTLLVVSHDESFLEEICIKREITI